jgi:hypothetical protein
MWGLVSHCHHDVVVVMTPTMQVMLHCRCIAIISVALHCQGGTVATMASTMQMALYCHCTAIIVVALA